MTPKLEQLLYEKYPKLYRQHTLSPPETCMCWGFSCGSGWFELIDTLSHFVSLDETVEAVQVKEKFGTLRFYYNGGTEYTSKLINFFELASHHVCEECGEWSELRGETWIYNRCEKCYAKIKG